MDSEGINFHFFTSRTSLEHKAELYNLCQGQNPNRHLRDMKMVEVQTLVPTEEVPRGAIKPSHITSKGETVYPNQRASIVMHGSQKSPFAYGEVTCYLMNKAKTSKLKEEQWMLFASARNMATDLGCCGRQHSLFPITPHATDLTLILSI